MKKTQTYTAYFPTKDFYQMNIPSQVLIGEGTTPKKALYNILRIHTKDDTRSENARTAMASRVRKNLIKERGLSKIIFNIEETIEHNKKEEGSLKYVSAELACELLKTEAVETKREALHFGEEMLRQYMQNFHK